MALYTPYEVQGALRRDSESRPDAPRRDVWIFKEKVDDLGRATSGAGELRSIGLSERSRVARSMIRIVLATALILLVPLLAMQFTDEVNWDLADFAVVGALLIGTGLMYELASSKVSNVKYRAAVGVALVAALLLVWAELAVGIFGTPISGQ